MDFATFGLKSGDVLVHLVTGESVTIASGDGKIGSGGSLVFRTRGSDKSLYSLSSITKRIEGSTLSLADDYVEKRWLSREILLVALGAGTGSQQKKEINNE